MGWNSTPFLGFARRMRSWCLGLSIQLNASSPRLQQKLYLEFRAIRDGEPVSSTMLRRVPKLYPAATASHISCLCKATRV
eukprot:2252205-Pyramimonas_sp.AAC.1